MRLLNIGKWRRDAEHLLEAERPGMLQYACYRLGNRADAEDAVQDTFVRVHRRMAQGDFEQGNLTGYLYRTLANLCVSRQREAGRRTMVSLDGQGGAAFATSHIDDSSVSEAEDFEQEYGRISRLLCEIPDEQAEVIRLHYYGNKTFREIAEMLGLPVTTVKSRFVYGLEKIRKGLNVKNREL
ncbi:MAG: RNA polymerase sigma factor [Bacteroidaceae bacterium]|nr:RNA polymerase sigma factor [Bacteroidaceae bacterium]